MHCGGTLFGSAGSLHASISSRSSTVAACVASGARSIVVLPYMLAPGRHAAGDIPRLARDAAARHAGVTVRVSEPLGVHPGLALAVLDRVAEAVAAPADQADDPAE